MMSTPHSQQWSTSAHSHGALRVSLKAAVLTAGQGSNRTRALGFHQQAGAGASWESSFLPAKGGCWVPALGPRAFSSQSRSWAWPPPIRSWPEPERAGCHLRKQGLLSRWWRG